MSAEPDRARLPGRDTHADGNGLAPEAPRPGQTICVTGGAGYIGCVLTERLLERGYRVRVLDRLYWGSEPLAGIEDRIEIVEADVRDVPSTALDGIDGVIHLAGLSNDPTAEYDPEANWQMNAVATEALGRACAERGIERFVFASSCSLYDGLPPGMHGEDAPVDPHGAYSTSKHYAEQRLLELVEAGLCPVILRNGTAYGWSPRMRLDLVVNTMFRTALQRGRITVNNPSIWRPILAIQDAAAAYVRAVEASPSVSGTFNVASENTTLGALADQVAATLKRNMDLEPELEILHKTDVRNYKVAIERARVQLGFKPSYDIDRIVWDLVQNREAFADFDNPAYDNITTFRSLTMEEHLGVSRMRTPAPSGSGSRAPVEV